MAEYTDHLYCDTFPYITPAQLSGCKAADGMADNDDRILDAIDDASTVLYYLTGKQFAGTCQATVRPGCLSGSCWCGCTPHQVNLGVWPVTELISVRYGGTLYTGSAATDLFHINDWHYLARNDGERFLSGNQWAQAGGVHDNASPDGYVFEATVKHGIKIPRLMTRATKALACQFIEASCGKECDLPARVTSVVRAGISMNIASVVDLLNDEKTGIYEVDLAIHVFNPSKLQSPSFAWHPVWSNPSRRVGT